MNALHNWFRTPLGEILQAQELAAVRSRLRGSYLRRLLQIGSLGRGGYPLPVDPALQQYQAVMAGEGAGDLIIDADELPFQAASVDAVVLVHSLDYSPYPHQLLREVERILAPEGQLLVLGFNPYSLWGLSRVWSQGDDLPQARQHLSVRRLRDWFTLLGLQPGHTDRLLFRPPWQNPRLQRHLASLDRYGPRLLPWVGGAYLCSAKKRVPGVTLLRPAWQQRPRLIPGLAQPTRRNGVRFENGTHAA